MPPLTLTQSQLQIINHPFPSKIQINGGPGTGKTSTLKQLYNRLLLTTQHSDILVLLFNTEAITSFTDSSTTIPPKHFHVKTFKELWFGILQSYLLQTQGIELIQLSSIDLRLLKNKFSRGCQNQTIYLQQDPKILYLTPFQILQRCEKYYSQDKQNFSKYLKVYEYILIDEFQDIDTISFKLLLDHYQSKNIIVSGNDDESLFSWTKITVNNSMQAFKQKFTDSNVFLLQDSFRCTENNIATGEIILKPIRGRIHKKVLTKNQYNRPLYVRKYQSDKKEADEIAKQIKLLHKEKNENYEEVAVLCRRRKLENNITRSMRRHHIPIARENIGLDGQIEVILSVMRLYLNRKDFIAEQLVKEFLEGNKQLAISIEKVMEFLGRMGEEMKIGDAVTAIARLFKLGTNRSNYSEFIRYISSAHPYPCPLSQSIKAVVRQSQIYPSNKGVSVISSLSIKGLQFKYVFIPGFNYYNYRYSTEQEQRDARKILYSTVSRSSDFVCISYFNIMNPLGVEFTKLSKKVMELQLKGEESQE